MLKLTLFLLASILCDCSLAILRKVLSLHLALELANGRAENTFIKRKSQPGAKMPCFWIHSSRICLGFGEKNHTVASLPLLLTGSDSYFWYVWQTYCIYPRMGESPITLFIPRQVCILVRNSQHTSLLHRLALPAGARPDYVCEAVNYAAFTGSAADRHRGGPSPLPLHSGAQRSEGLCFTFTNKKECDCRLAQPQDVRGKQETIINLRLPSNSGHQTEFLPEIVSPLSLFSFSHSFQIFFFFFFKSLLQY